VRHPAGFLPALAALRATAYVRARNCEAAVEQRYPIAVEIRIVGVAVGTVADHVQGRASVASETIFAKRERHRDPVAVARLRPESFTGIRRRVITDDRLLLAQHAFAGCKFDTEGREWARQRRIDISDKWRCRLGIHFEY